MTVRAQCNPRGRSSTSWRRSETSNGVTIDEVLGQLHDDQAATSPSRSEWQDNRFVRIKKRRLRTVAATSSRRLSSIAQHLDPVKGTSARCDPRCERR